MKTTNKKGKKMNTLDVLNTLKTNSLITLTDESRSDFDKAVFQICSENKITPDNHNIQSIFFDDKEVVFVYDKGFGDDKLQEIFDIIQYTSKAYNKHIIPSEKYKHIVLISDVKDSLLPEEYRNSGHARVHIMGGVNFIHFISTQCLVSSKWLTRHEAVHIADHLLGITNAPSSIEPDVTHNDETGVKAVWDMIKLDKIRYCEQNPQEQLVVDVLSQKYNIPADIMLNLAHGVYSDFYRGMLEVVKNLEGSKKQFKQEVKEFVKEHVLPKGYPDYYVDILKIFKSKNTWMI